MLGIIYIIALISKMRANYQTKCHFTYCDTQTLRDFP